MYLDNTLQVKTALLGRPDLLEKLRTVFISHILKDGIHVPIGRGSLRFAYEIGECEVAADIRLNLLLKLYKVQPWISYSRAAEPSQHGEWCEFGAFETYYDFVAGHIDNVSFRSNAGYRRYISTSILGKNVKRTFSFADQWGGTEVEQGDLGAIPYFQLAVRYKTWFGQLTEGLPSLIKPKGTAEYWGTMDEHTVEKGRIIDIGLAQCLLIDIDRGGALALGKRYPNNLGVRTRGGKYFLPANRLDI